MPTDALVRLDAVMRETRDYGFAKVKAEQQELGDKVRALFARKASRAWQPKASRHRRVVSYTTDRRSRTAKNSWPGLQTAPGAADVRRPADFQTFRVGLFGLDKLHNIDRTVKSLEKALDHVI